VNAGSVVIHNLCMAWWNFLSKSTGCCLSPLSPLKKSTSVLDVMIRGDGDRVGVVVVNRGDGGGGGGCVGRSSIESAGDVVRLVMVQSTVLVTVAVSSGSRGRRSSLVLLDVTLDMAMVAGVSAGAKQPRTHGCVCQWARVVSG
jgi:hypothetical protein